jgi:hypothetical protein
MRALSAPRGQKNTSAHEGRRPGRQDGAAERNPNHRARTGSPRGERESSPCASPCMRLAPLARALAPAARVCEAKREVHSRAQGRQSSRRPAAHRPAALPPLHHQAAVGITIVMIVAINLDTDDGCLLGDYSSVSSAAPLAGRSRQKTSWKPITTNPRPGDRPLPTRNFAGPVLVRVRRRRRDVHRRRPRLAHAVHHQPPLPLRDGAKVGGRAPLAAPLHLVVAGGRCH